MTTFLLIGAVVLVVAALLALDWFTAGRARRRINSAQDGEAGNPNPGYALIEQQSIHMQQKHGS